MYFLHHLTISAKLWESPQCQSLLRTCREPVCFELRHLVVKKNKLAFKQSCWCFRFRSCSLCLFTSLSPLCQQQTNQSRMSIAGSDSHSTAETEHLHLEGHVSDINSAEKPPTPGLFLFFFINFILFPANFAGVFGGQNLHHRWDCSVQTSCPQNYSGGAGQEVKHNPLNPVQSAAVACARSLTRL